MAYQAIVSRRLFPLIWRIFKRPGGCVLAFNALLWLGLGGCPPVTETGGTDNPAQPSATDNANDTTATAGDTVTNAAGDAPAAPEESIPEVISFARDVVPIFQMHCAICHAPGATADRAGISLRLTSREAYDSLVNQTSSQTPLWKRVVPGDVERSLLYYKVSQAEPPIGNRMPLACAPLTGAQVQIIHNWIEQGALNN